MIYDNSNNLIKTSIKEYKTKNYIVTVKKDYEELSPYDCFDKTEYDVKNICQKIKVLPFKLLEGPVR